MSLQELPAVPGYRIAVRVTPRVLRQVRRGHPWVYADAVTSVRGGAADNAPPGTLAVVFDEKRDFVAIGLWDPKSPIRVRVLHAGEPVLIDPGFWTTRVATAAAQRRELVDSGTTGYRLLNGENDGTGGLVVDRYDATLVVKLYTEAWLPHLQHVLDALDEIMTPERIVLRLGRMVSRSIRTRETRPSDGEVVRGSPIDGPIRFSECGLVFEADVQRGQKTGHFLDQRDNRKAVGARSANARVLDVFACTGGFSVHAAAGGATMVHSVDRSAPALTAAVCNMELNAGRTATTAHRTTVGDAFDVLARLGGAGERHDIVILDPPAFAIRSRERDRAVRAYRTLTALAEPLLARGATLVQASCSAHVTGEDLRNAVTGVLLERGRSVAGLESTGHGVDHPVRFPQGRYLDAVFVEVG